MYKTYHIAVRAAAAAALVLGLCLTAQAGSPAQTKLDTTPAATAAADYTGLIIDARDLPDILRSPSPAIYGPAPDNTLLYPDRTHVPTPDEVQDESVVRYYHTVDDAKKGVGGDNPLILKADKVLGYAHDSLELSAADMAKLQDLDKKIHFSLNWKVGFLIPAGQ